ncbi:3-hydroxyacyl-CoA dehydrogenase [Hephaestia caeni]|uniref:3-hydroxyacyl-CoA dehydrogenase n=1 Tax=Hephaestia caeni TaxID=645617 RepID=A0A397NNI6_9SPHN|nr:3-hydroxyacyl-CoA dehydrogenase NAD-binding domain-containing protein [Hephaestia caeni]RIA37978.1 3-hydroxyacyl-CoA dehydrogenase [Hephaestia caeni]
MQNFTYTVDKDGIATFLFDVPGRTMNTFTESAVADLDAIVAVIREDRVTGAVLASGKDNGFCAGADLGELGETAGAGLTGDALAAALKGSSRMSWALRAIETVGKPVVAALEGIALGGGFEFALAAHHRVASSRAKVGLPEVTIGLLPGAGGTQRTTRLAGPRAALDLMISGAPIDAAKAQALGLIDAVVEPGAAIAAAKAWITGGGDGVAPWDRKGYQMPGGPYTAEGAPVFMTAAAQIHAKSYGNYPAQKNIARCVYEGFGLPMDAALRVEARLFLATQQTPQARAMIRSNFISKQALAKGAARPAGVPAYTVGKAAVLGAGMMGAGIAYVQARAGIETVLIDTSQEGADKGKAYSAGVIEKGIARGTTTAEAGDALLARIHATTDYAAIAGADLVVEAVFEDRALKAEVTRRAEAQIGTDAVFASNTSTLPISELAGAAERPANFIGIHFFSPVDRMELVEIIVGKETSPETLAKAMDYCRALKKVPIVVNDSRGFYTSRVFETYITEGLEMLLDGIAPAIIDNVGRMTGMPRGPLELADDVAIDLLDRIAGQRRVDFGLGDPNGGTDKVLVDLVGAERLGRKNGKGFYTYAKGEPKRLWDGLADLYPVTVERSTPELVETLKRRLLYRQAIEAARCMDEGVVTAPRDADVGAILGWGFAPWSGGPISLIDSVGVAEFVARTRAFAADHGDRFTPPALLERMAAAGDSFYPAPKAAAAA